MNKTTFHLETDGNGGLHIEIDGQHNDIVQLMAIVIRDHRFIIELFLDAIELDNNQKFQISKN